ncbi:YdcF family protein [Pasteurella atlantica]|uniref:YdcF family protein n=1 Tax=Pasteurellaceae TaxID=712 RepID=UPI002754FF94|nr:ElyC/SanA/YdcF family protein [Pasteurella atlantica]MDP8098257.1 ElyC/SanA/YdcF family protein [Pasteurella atlantica]MDP8106534.1 ElyC/SanA/YdcF family protein [Pasteurella atlantica]MDP8116060.1 ElyC/SanA/YdcF family protein [Pasteurella atlantica]
MSLFLKTGRIILLIIGMILIIDCSILFLFLKFNFGTVVPFLIGVIFVAHAIFWEKIQDFIAQNKWQKRVWYLLWSLFIIWLISFVIFVLALVKQINSQPPATKIQAVIILGAGVNGDKPTPTLASRLDKAVQIIHQQPTLPTIITAGGVDFGRDVSEAYVMAKYLQEQHRIPIKVINQENKSQSTEENLLFSQPILINKGISPNTDKIAIVTNDFHTIRAKAIAQKQGYNNVITVASTTPLSIRFNAWFREYFAFISGWLLREY